MHRLPAHTVEDPAAAVGSEDVEAMLIANAVETVIVAGLDSNGLLRGKRVPARGIAAVLEHGVAMCDVLWALPVDEAAPVPPPPGHAGYFPRDGFPDMILRPQVPNYNSASQQLQVEIQNALLGKKDAQQALNDAAKAFAT